MNTTMMKKGISLLFMALIGVSVWGQSLPINGDQYHLYGPNTTWGEYLKVGGNGRETTNASVVATNGNLHLDSKNGFATYINYYSLGNTFINSQGGKVGIGTNDPYRTLHIMSGSYDHQLRLEGKNGKHTWIEFLPSGSDVINWQIGANTNGFSVYDKVASSYRFTISNSGDIGIGTSTPDSRLVIFDGSNGISIHPGDVQGIGFNRNVKNGTIYNKSISGWQFTARNESFSLEGYNGANSNLMTILKDGNVGIATRDPKELLHIRSNKHSLGAFISNDNSSGYSVLRLNANAHAAEGGALHHMGAAYNSSGAYGPNTTALVGFENGGLSLSAENMNGNITFFTGGTANSNERLRILQNGKIGIGTTTPDAKLDVAGNIKAQEIEVTLASIDDMQLNGTLAANQITVTTNGHTADFVFEEDYELRDLQEVETFIQTNKHLPDIPSAAVMEADGVNLAEMNKLLLLKIEELTLYAIDKDNRIQELEAEGAKQKTEVETQKAKVKSQNEKVESLEERLAKIEALLLAK